MKTRSAFSLLEVLVVLAFLALVAGLVTSNFDRLIPAVQAKPLERVFFEAVQDARILAAVSGNEVAVRFDEEGQVFVVEERMVAESAAWDWETSKETTAFRRSGGVEVLFHPREVDEARFGRSAERYSDRSVRELIFHPSGVSTPARVTFRWPDGRDDQFILDPLSSGPLETGTAR